MYLFFDIDATLVDHKKASELAAAKFLQSFAHLLPYSQVEFLRIWHRCRRLSEPRGRNGRCLVEPIQNTYARFTRACNWYVGRIRAAFADTCADSLKAKIAPEG